MDRIHALMGVCPQFDILWNELTGREHLHLYGHVKVLSFATNSLNALTRNKT
jgi:ABC-type multidrug transport system ATPase subunit